MSRRAELVELRRQSAALERIAAAAERIAEALEREPAGVELGELRHIGRLGDPRPPGPFG